MNDILGLGSHVHESAAKGENNCHQSQRCFYLLEELLTNFNQGKEKNQSYIFWKDDLAVKFRWNCSKPGVCWCLLTLACILLWPAGHHHSFLSALSICLLECISLNERLDISPNIPQSLSLEYTFLLLAVLCFKFISPVSPWGSLPRLPQPGQVPPPGDSCFPLLNCIIDISCLPFSLWNSNPLMAGTSFMWSFIHVVSLRALLIVGSTSEQRTE